MLMNYSDEEIVKQSVYKSNCNWVQGRHGHGGWTELTGGANLRGTTGPCWQFGLASECHFCTVVL